MTQDLDTLVTALYVKIDDTITTPRWRGRPPRLTDAELVCLAIAQVLVCTPTGMPILWALATPKIGEREVLAAMLEVEADVLAEHQGILLIADKGFASKPLERRLAERGITLLRPLAQAGAGPLRRADAQEGPAVDRVGQRHAQGPARPGRTRRANFRRRCRTRRPATAGHGRRDLAQQQDRSIRHPVPDRLRPLTGLGTTRLDRHRRRGTAVRVNAAVEDAPSVALSGQWRSCAIRPASSSSRRRSTQPRSWATNAAASRSTTRGTSVVPTARSMSRCQRPEPVPAPVTSPSAPSAAESRSSTSSRSRSSGSGCRPMTSMNMALIVTGTGPWPTVPHRV